MDEINLIDINPENDEKDLVSYFESLTGKTLYPAQDERIMLSVISHQSTLNKIAFNNAMRQVFLRYASGIFLDLYGDLLDCPRLEANQGVDVLQVKLYEVFGIDKILPKGSEIETKDGEYIFITNEDLIIPAGQMYGTVAITSELAGSILNGYRAGDITTLIKNYEYIEAVTNLNGVSGASDAEDDDSYRERLYIAPEKFSTAGPEEAYEYFAKSAHKDIVDVKVLSTTAGTIDIYVLTKDGEASNAILEAVSAAVSDIKVRPLTDLVRVHSAIKEDFNVSPSIKIEINADYQNVILLINNAIADYFKTLREGLGIEVIKSHIITALKNLDGVYDVIIPDDLSALVGDKTKFYNGSIGTLSVTRVS